MVKIYTIGFKGKSARSFFTILKKQGIQKLIDVRRKNISQLAGFTKGPDLNFFLEECFNIKYEHVPEFAPSENLLKEYQTRLGKKKKDDAAWAFYVEDFKHTVLSLSAVNKFCEITKGYEKVCFLCSEETAERCHRRLLVEYFKEHQPLIEIFHI